MDVKNISTVFAVLLMQTNSVVFYSIPHSISDFIEEDKTERYSVILKIVWDVRKEKGRRFFVINIL